MPKLTLLRTILRICLGTIMLVIGISHLTFLRAEFHAQVPNLLPFSKDLVVIVSGIVEIVLGLTMIFFVKHQRKVGIALAIFFIIIFPGNISQYLNQTDAFNLNTDRARFLRLFFQPVLIFWALFSTGQTKIDQKDPPDKS